MQDNLTELVFVLDRSGSMNAVWSDAVEALDVFVEEQKKAPGEARLTLAVFDDEYEEVLKSVPLKEVVPKTAEKHAPRGWTALLDAIGKTIATVGERLKDTPEDERPVKVAFAVMTDGMENASTEYTKERVKEMVEHQTEKYGWEFFFLGANLDAFVEGSGVGVKMSNTMNFCATPRGIRQASSSLSKMICQYRSDVAYDLSQYDQSDTADGAESGTR